MNHINRLHWIALMEVIVLSDGGARYVQIVKALLDAGADVHIADKEGITPLQHALDHGYAEIVVLLRQAGAQR